MFLTKLREMTDIAAFGTFLTYRCTVSANMKLDGCGDGGATIETCYGFQCFGWGGFVVVVFEAVAILFTIADVFVGVMTYTIHGFARDFSCTLGRALHPHAFLS